MTQQPNNLQVYGHELVPINMNASETINIIRQGRFIYIANFIHNGNSK